MCVNFVIKAHAECITSIMYKKVFHDVLLITDFFRLLLGENNVYVSMHIIIPYESDDGITLNSDV